MSPLFFIKNIILLMKLNLAVFICRIFIFFSNSLKWNLHRTMNLFIIFWNRLNIRVPSVFFTHFFYSCSTEGKVLFRARLRIFAESWPISSINRTRRLRSSGFLPIIGWSSKEWNGIGKLLSLHVFLIYFMSVRNISVKNEWSSI